MTFVVRWLARQTAVLAVLLVVIAPMWLGPATSPFEAALGGPRQHKCACGMVRGKCGCLECAQLEHERQRPSKVPTIRSTCEDDDSPLPSAPLPPCVLPSASILESASAKVDEQPPLSEWAPVDQAPPPTPPPRVLAL